MSMVLLRREIRANYKLVLIFMAVLIIYGGTIVNMFDPKLGESLNAMAQSMPELFAAFGMLNVGTTLIEFISNYLYGFLLIALPLVFIILLSSRVMTRYVDNGSMAYLLAGPHTRRSIAFSQVVALLLGCVTLVLFVTAFCLGCAQVLFPGELPLKPFLLLNTGLLGLLVFLSGVCFFFSCLFNDSRYATGCGTGLCVLFLLVQMLSQVSEKLENLRFATPLTLFNASALIASESGGIWQFCILYVAGLILCGAGIAVFSKKDLPL